MKDGYKIPEFDGYSQFWKISLWPIYTNQRFIIFLMDLKIRVMARFSRLDRNSYSVYAIFGNPPRLPRYFVRQKVACMQSVFPDSVHWTRRSRIGLGDRNDARRQSVASCKATSSSTHQLLDWLSYAA